MATLSAAQRQTVTNEFMRSISRRRDVFPFVKSDLRIFINNVDDSLEAAETSTGANIPVPGGKRAWAQDVANETFMRRLHAFVERKRRELL